MKIRTSRGGKQYGGLTPREFERWDRLPYGCWTTTTGREVLFTRFYEPLYQREPGGPITPADPQEWVKDIALARWFYDSGKEPAVRRAAEAALAAWREGRLEDIPTTTMRDAKGTILHGGGR